MVHRDLFNDVLGEDQGKGASSGIDHLIKNGGDL